MATKWGLINGEKSGEGGTGTINEMHWCTAIFGGCLEMVNVVSKLTFILRKKMKEKFKITKD